MEAIKITALEVSDVKRIHAVSVECSPDGLTIIGGKNGAGKTSVLDAIAFAVGGEKYRPSSLQREGAESTPAIKVTLSNGLIVERGGKNAALKVTDPSGMKGGQKLLDSFVSQFALDLPKFLNSTAREKAKVLLQVIGVGDDLAKIEADEARIYAERTTLGRDAEQSLAVAVALPMFDGVPNEPVSVSALVTEARAMDEENRERERLASELAELVDEGKRIAQDIKQAREEIAQMEARHGELGEAYQKCKGMLGKMPTHDTSAINIQIENAEETNLAVFANQSKAKALADAQSKRKAHAAADLQLIKTRDAKADLLASADLPLPGLSIDNGELIYNGRKWDCMSGADQMRVGTACVRGLNPACGFVLLNELEQMDLETLAEFGAWMLSEGLQGLATRVSTGSECSIIIEDGMVKEPVE